MLQLYTRRARGASIGTHGLGSAPAARSSRHCRPASEMRLPDSSSTACSSALVLASCSWYREY